jgi:hypothetical protein
MSVPVENSDYGMQSYKYLLKSARRYAELLGVSLKHKLCKEQITGIRILYNDFLKILPNGQELNIESIEDKTHFVVYKAYPFRQDTMTYFPLKYIYENLPTSIYEAVRSFMAHLFKRNDFMDFRYDHYGDWFEEHWSIREEEGWDDDVDNSDRFPVVPNEVLRFLRNEEIIKPTLSVEQIRSVLKGYRGKKYAKLVRCILDGFYFIEYGKESLLGDYSYDYTHSGDDAFDDHYYDGEPIQIESFVRYIYSNDDSFTEFLCECFNNEAVNGSEELAPAKSIILTPETKETLIATDYPNHFFTWGTRLIKLLQVYERTNH